MIQAERRTERVPEEPERKLGDDSGPNKPEIGKPAAPNELLRRLRNVDPDQAKRYRQRSGE
jgi:hypothetical protein